MTKKSHPAFSSIFLTMVILVMMMTTSWQPTPAEASAAAQAAPWPAYQSCVPESLMILETDEAAGMQRALQQLEALGGCALHIYPPSAVIGIAPAAANPEALAQAGVKAVYTSSVDVQALAAESETVQSAAGAWNSLLAGPLVPEPPPAGARPLTFDRRTVQPRVDQPDPLNAVPHAADYYSTSLYMAGKVAVGIITPESNGSGENWSEARQDTVRDEIQAAMNWWNTHNPYGGMSFSYDERRAVPTTLEPISGSSASDGIWIKETLGNLGYTDSTWETRAIHYMNDIRTTSNSDWAVVVYIVDSLNDADGMFTDGYFGYAYGWNNGSGLLVVMTYDNDGWGIGNMDSVFAHEFGHLFGADDEYCQPGYACCWGSSFGGYLNVANTNCEAGCDGDNNGVCDGNDSTPGSGCQGCPTCVQVNCLMRNGGVSSGLDTPSKQQVGMRDTDGDNILDPVDTTPTMALTAYTPDPTNDPTPTWNGSSTDIPYNAPDAKYTDTTINYLSAVEFYIDSGPWQACLANDGAFNETTEDFSCTPGAPLTNGNHTIYVRSRNRAGNYSAIASDSVFVYIETDPPTNPTWANSNCTATDNAWQNTCNDPDFTWGGASDGTGSGVAGYYYYWGADPAGASSNYTTSAGYNPPMAPSPSIYFLRIRTRDNAGNISAWATLFTFRYETNLPHSAVTSIVALTPSQLYQVNWSGFDVNSGVLNYDMQYRVGASGVWTNWLMGTTLTSANFGPAAPLTLAPGETYYFRVRARDQAGNLEAYPSGNGDQWFTVEITHPPLYLPLVFTP